MDTNNNTLDKIELRSEKVRKLLGEIPQSLVRWGDGNHARYFYCVISASLSIALSIFKWGIYNRAYIYDRFIDYK